MGDRKAIGASLAAAAIFSVILIANAALLSGSEEHEVLAAQGDAESYLAANSSALQATIALALLDGLQESLSARTLPCVNSSAYVEASVDGVPFNQSMSQVSGSGELEPGMNLTEADDFTALYPFNGWRGGDLNVLSDEVVTGGVEYFGVSLNVSQQYRLSLPVRLGRMSEICVDALAAAEAPLVQLSASGCNASAVGQAVDAVASEMRASAESYGLEASLGYTLEPLSRCSVVLLSEVNETGIQGPLGTFSVALEQEATLALPTGNASGLA